MSDFSILTGDCLAHLRSLPEQSVQCVVTSPPYWGLRDYGVVGQLGLEKTPEEYVAKMVSVFREVRRVLAKDGTLWLNLGDSYAHQCPKRQSAGVGARGQRDAGALGKHYTPPGFKNKDLVGIPWRVAFALQADGWYLRSDIIWHKPNPMPESITDRPTKAHEYIFLLTKSARYFYDHEAVQEPAVMAPQRRLSPTGYRKGVPGQSDDSGGKLLRGVPERERETRNRRSVWTVTTRPFKGAHFATFPPDLIEPCILAGSRPGDIVLDPFNGAGTTGLVALKHGRDYLGIELNPEYVAISENRLAPFVTKEEQEEDQTEAVV